MGYVSFVWMKPQTFMQNCWMYHKAVCCHCWGGRFQLKISRQAFCALLTKLLHISGRMYDCLKVK
jgi:hypothetical protein